MRGDGHSTFFSFTEELLILVLILILTFLFYKHN